jgi:short subunit fatty acids transporter
MTWYSKGFGLDINTTILIFLLVGLALQRTPIACADAIRKAARQTGSMLLQYPVYGGIMGIMMGTGLASVIAKTFVAIATATTLPVWSYLSSLIITLLIPSAGGHWAVQGPFVLPAALSRTLPFRAPPWASQWRRTCPTCCNPSGLYPSLQLRAFVSSASWATRRLHSSCRS